MASCYPSHTKQAKSGFDPFLTPSSVFLGKLIEESIELKAKVKK
jgi:hypothetical protein